MKFENVSLESFGYALPEEVVTSEELEHRLAPLYEQHRLHPGRLELMTGIRERRFWPPGTRPSQVAAEAGRRALERSGVPRERIGGLVFASVCRDFMEPATASVVHAALGLSPRAFAYDLSNACLGFANAVTVLAGDIERGALDAGLVVAGEDGRPLVEATIAQLLSGATRDQLKQAFASLTIGSGAVACVVASRELAGDRRRLRGAALRADTGAVGLCQGDRLEGSEGPLMETDSEALLEAGRRLAGETFADFREELGWRREDLDRVVTHQVGSAHRKAVLGALEVPLERDFPTVDRLGNIGSVSLPLSYALAEEEGFIEPGHRVGLLGIGSGLHCLMLGVEA